MIFDIFYFSIYIFILDVFCLSDLFYNTKKATGASTCFACPNRFSFVIYYSLSIAFLLLKCINKVIATVIITGISHDMPIPKRGIFL